MADKNMSDQSGEDDRAAVPEDSEPPVSVVDVERAAARIRPTWEVEDEDGQEQADESADADEVSLEGLEELDELEEQPGEAPIPLNRRSSPREPSGQQVEESSEPVDIVATVPKRTEVEIKDEPSVVLAPELEEPSIVGVDEDPFAAAPPSKQQTAKVAWSEQGQGARNKNVKIVGAVVGVAALIAVVGLVIKFTGSSPSNQAADGSASSPANTAQTGSEKSSDTASDQTAADQEKKQAAEDEASGSDTEKDEPDKGDNDHKDESASAAKQASAAGHAQAPNSTVEKKAEEKPPAGEQRPAAQPPSQPEEKPAEPPPKEESKPTPPPPKPKPKPKPRPKPKPKHTSGGIVREVPF